MTNAITKTKISGTKTDAEKAKALKNAKGPKPGQARSNQTVKYTEETKVDKDAIVQSSGSSDKDTHFVKSVGGETFTFPTVQWKGQARQMCAIGKSFKAAKAYIATLPAPTLTPSKPQLARGIAAKDAAHSAKAVADQNRGAKATNKADAVTQKPKAAKPPKADEKAAKLAASDNRKITFVAPNPKRPESASFARYAKYKKGMTVAQAIAAGVTRADIDWDSKREFIKFA